MSIFLFSFFILIVIELKLNFYFDYYVDFEEFFSYLIFFVNVGVFKVLRININCYFCIDLMGCDVFI